MSVIQRERKINLLKDFYTEFDEESVGLRTDMAVSSESVEAGVQKCRCFENFPLAMAYVPMQKFENIYSVNEALTRGTLFKDLDLPFLGYLNKGVR